MGNFKAIKATGKSHKMPLTKDHGLSYLRSDCGCGGSFVFNSRPLLRIQFRTSNLSCRLLKAKLIASLPLSAS